MTIEKYYLSQREAFLSQAREAQDDSALLAGYKGLMEQMKSCAMSQHPHEDVLRQVIALLFYAAMQGAEMTLVRDLPTVVYRQREDGAPKARRLPSVLLHPYVRCAVLALGVAISLLGGLGAWKYAAVFALAAGLEALCLRPAGKEGPEPIAASALRIDYLDSFIIKQAKRMDQQIEDVKNLLADQEASCAGNLEAPGLALCQNVWAAANANYPVDMAMDAVEKLLRQNGAALVEYAPDVRNWFEVMPTRQASHTVYPAIKRTGDGSLLCRGQYVENKG